MRVIKADQNRRLEIPGVPGPVRRPVDIDRTSTDFKNLRSLRIYRFDAGSLIDGHAEEDEVFVVVMSGSITLTISDDNSQPLRPSSLSAANDSHNDPSVAYLRPGSAYQLVAITDADIAYARSTPSGGRPSYLFKRNVRVAAIGVAVLFEETSYAERLRLRLVYIDARQNELTFMPLHESEAACEGLIHLRTEPAEGAAAISSSDFNPIPLDSWDTISVASPDRLALRFTKGSSALVLVTMAD